MKFNGFDKKGIEFLQELSKNNSKVWFEDNRHIWEQTIHNPNINFIEDMGETLQILVPTINFKPKVGGSLFKIYRDVRFSKDKTPMKSKIGLLFWQGQTHRMQSSSFYIHYDKDSYFIASGIRGFKAPLLKTYRNYMQNENHRVELHNILEDIKSKGYSIPEPKYKRIPKEFDFDKDAKYTELVKYDTMFAYKQFTIKDDDIFFKIEFLDKAFGIFDDLKELQVWLYNMTINN